MKKISCNTMYRSLMVLVFSFWNILLFAQDTTVSTRTTSTTSQTTTTDWYAQPWVWVVGGAVFLIILIALLRGNSSSNKEVSNTRTTVIKDDRTI
ncbi:MAG TPA: hypothetical protein VF487_19415 [Chitinophagaceae bacterium]